MLSLFVITAIVFLFFALRLRPVEIPSLSSNDIEAGTVEAPVVSFVNPARGSESPKVIIIEYGDFQCEACRTLGDSIEVVLRTYPEDVRHIWKDMPNESAHELATPAAIAAHCADEQGGFWPYHDMLFEQQAYLTENQFAVIAETIGLDVNAWTSCYEQRDTLGIVKRDFEEALGLGLIATPTIYVNDEQYVGAISTEELVRLIEKELAN